MAAQNRIVTLDLGTQTVLLAELKAGADGSLTLINFRSTELLADPAADASRQGQTRVAVDEMATGMGLKGHLVNYAVASQSVFTRFVKLPSVGEEQVDQIVTFEAQQNVPYPINEVVWDYQLVETGDSSQVEVVIVAIKSDLLDEINGAVEGPGLKTGIVDISPMALYNAYRYNYSDHTGCALVIDIGSRTTNLVFVEPKKVFSRSIPTGGNTITGAIAKDFGEGFSESEQRKKTDGFVSLGGAYADPEDPDTARVSKITRNSMTRLHAEITRSISFYRSQQGGSAPTRVYLAGGTASMPYMREFFQEKFQVPVEFFNPLRNVKVAPNLDMEEIGHKAHTFGGIVGLALRRASGCPMELNLQPASVERRERETRQRPAFTLAAICLLAGLAIWYLYFTRSAQLTAQAAEAIEPAMQQLQNYDGKLQGVRKEIKAEEETAAPMLEAVRERDYWAKVLADITTRLPKDYVWITSFDPQMRKQPVKDAKGKPVKGKTEEQKDENVIEIEGLYLLNDRGPAVVDDFIAKLKESELYTVDAAPPHVREVQNDGGWAFHYSLALLPKEPIAIAQSLTPKKK